jgi:hypothetical protein
MTEEMFEFDIKPKIVKIISGGQSGADVTGLEVAKSLGIETGGTAPKGFKTEFGPNLKLRDVYGLSEHSSEKYPPRTEDNVKNSDLTIIISGHDSPGSILTKKLCVAHKKPFIMLDVNEILLMLEVKELFDKKLLECGKNQLVLNVAGSRASKTPHIEDLTRLILLKMLEDNI